MENRVRRKRRDLREGERDLVKGAWPGTRGKVVRVGRCSCSAAPPEASQTFPNALAFIPPPVPHCFLACLSRCARIPCALLCLFPHLLLVLFLVPGPCLFRPPISVFPRPCPYIPSEHPCALLTPPLLCPLPPPSPGALSTPPKLVSPCSLFPIASCAYVLPEPPGVPVSQSPVLFISTLLPRAFLSSVSSRPPESHAEPRR